MAGLFEGEGTIFVGKESSRLRVAIELTDLDVLERVQAFFWRENLFNQKKKISLERLLGIVNSK